MGIVPFNHGSTTGAPTEHEMIVYNTIATKAVASKMYKNLGDEHGIMMMMLAARELNIPPMLALNGGLNIIQGKVEISARIMSALIRKSGHSISIKENSDTTCTLSGKRADNGDTATVTYTIQEAQKAGLVKPTSGWVKNPKDMLFARAISRLARQLYSDVIGIGYIEGEIRALEPDNAVVEPKKDLLQEYMEVFYPDERPFAVEYLKEVQKHFNWTEEQTLSELLKDTQTMIQKFKKWKNKYKTVEA